DHGVAHPHLVRRVAARNDQRVDILHLDRAGRHVGSGDCLAALAAVLDAGARTGHHDRDASRAQRFQWTGQLAIFELIFPQHRGRLARQRALAHAAMLPHVIIWEMTRLARERSPYLLQHAANPVDWYPWGDEAFAKARREDKPIFLSVGYSTCHWCHVMEHE